MADAKPRCPYLAINIPGERPFVVERRLYESITRGITIVDTALAKESVYIDSTVKFAARQGTIDGVWVLTIKHHTGRVRGTTRLFNLLQTRFHSPMEYRDFKLSLADWAARAFKKKSAVAAPTDKHMKQIARLEKELKRLYAHQPVNPLLREDCEYSGGREFKERWAQQRSQRMQLALIGAWALKGVISPAKAYELLDEAGYDVVKQSKLKTWDRTRLNGADYWQRLYLFERGMAEKREEWKKFAAAPLEQRLTEHRESLIRFIGAKREIDSIKTQIESIKQLAAMVVPAANETGVVYA